MFDLEKVKFIDAICIERKGLKNRKTKYICHQEKDIHMDIKLYIPDGVEEKVIIDEIRKMRRKLKHLSGLEMSYDIKVSHQNDANRERRMQHQKNNIPTKEVLAWQWEESISNLEKEISNFIDVIANSIIENAETLKDVDMLLDLFGKMGWKYPYCRQWEDHAREKVKEKISNIAIK